MASTLYTVSKDLEVAAIIDTARMSKPSISTKIVIYHDNTRKEIFGLALEINHIKGRINDVQHSFIKSNLVACAPFIKG